LPSQPDKNHQIVNTANKENYNNQSVMLHDFLAYLTPEMQGVLKKWLQTATVISVRNEHSSIEQEDTTIGHAKLFKHTWRIDMNNHLLKKLNWMDNF
jgi:hypothetical protein